MTNTVSPSLDVERYSTEDISAILGVLRRRLEQSWSAETSADPDGYTDPGRTASYGQCAVTALVVQDIFGGRLLRCTADGVSHYFNELASGATVDLTRDQFPTTAQFTPAEPREREYVLSHPATVQRYELLSSQVNPTR